MAEPIDFLEWLARLEGSRHALTDLARDRHWTYAELDQAVGQGVAQLRRHGVDEGDRVATLALNAAELVILNLACARLGALHVPLNWRLNPAELRTILVDAAPRLLIGDGKLAAAGLSGIDLDAFASEREQQTPVRPARPSEDRPSLILYTSGTYGQPKGAVHSEGRLAELARGNQLLGRITRNSTFLVDAPMFHIIGLIVSIRPVLMSGGTALISDGFNAPRTLARLGDRALGITHYFCVPQMATALRTDPAYQPHLFSGLAALFSGGAPHPAAQLRAWLADGIPVINRYGMTEAGTVFTMPADPTVIEAKAGSVGLTAPGVACRIVDVHGRDCPPNQPGELLIKSPSLMLGYWGNPRETRHAFTPDGWFRTGDIVRADADGFHWVEGRCSDMYISGGENVHPAEIESALVGDPDIEECAVVGVPDPQWGEAGVLFVKLAAHASLDPTRIRTTLAAKIARFKQPKHIHSIRTLPRNGGGKVLKRVLRPLAEELAREALTSAPGLSLPSGATAEDHGSDPAAIRPEPTAIAHPPR